ncbi:MAG: hypothetical protein ABI981_11340 [Betaproteobacteria bacterium]
MRASVATDADPFMTQAIEEHAAGHVDRTLWMRAVAQAGGDNAQAKSIYLRSRATALRVRKREKRAARYAGVVEALNAAPDPGFEPRMGEVDTEAPSPDSSHTRRGFIKRNRLRAMMAAGVFAALGVIVVVVTGVVVVPWGGDTSGQDFTSVSAPRFHVFGGGKPSAPAVPVAATVPAAAQTPSGEDYIRKLPALKKEGNWNLFVIYAVEWSRKQPSNADAWKELSQGYLKLRQYGEAQDAATKATQLAPEDFLQWQNLGQINLAVQAPMEALKAFERAAVLNDHDAVSLINAGLLYAQAARVPEARAAFDKALAVNAQDVQALCGAASVAQREGRVKDANEMRRQVTSLAERCSDASAGASVRVAADQAPRGKTGP